MDLERTGPMSMSHLKSEFPRCYKHQQNFPVFLKSFGSPFYFLLILLMLRRKGVKNTDCTLGVLWDLGMQTSAHKNYIISTRLRPTKKNWTNNTTAQVDGSAGVRRRPRCVHGPVQSTGAAAQAEVWLVSSVVDVPEWRGVRLEKCTCLFWRLHFFASAGFH